MSSSQGSASADALRPQEAQGGLNARQYRWLEFHGLGPTPHRWAWLDVYGRQTGCLKDRTLLRAWKRDSGRIRYATIYADDRAGLESYMDVFVVNERGRALISNAPAAGNHERAGTAYDAGACGYELQGRASRPLSPGECG